MSDRDGLQARLREAREHAEQLEKALQEIEALLDDGEHGYNLPSGKRTVQLQRIARNALSTTEEPNP